MTNRDNAQAQPLGVAPESRAAKLGGGLRPAVGKTGRLSVEWGTTVEHTEWGACTEHARLSPCATLSLPPAASSTPPGFSTLKSNPTKFQFENFIRLKLKRFHIRWIFNRHCRFSWAMASLQALIEAYLVRLAP